MGTSFLSNCTILWHYINGRKDDTAVTVSSRTPILRKERGRMVLPHDKAVKIATQFNKIMRQSPMSFILVIGQNNSNRKLADIDEISTYCNQLDNKLLSN